MRLLVAAGVAVLLTSVVASSREVGAVGRPGITPIACPEQTWDYVDPAFDAIPGAKAFFGRYDGGVYRIEIPANWNGDLVLYAHGFRANGGPDGSRLTVGLPSTLRAHLVGGGFAWAASSYRCNGYVPGIGLQDTMALRDLFARANEGRAPQRVYLTGTSMGGHVTLLGLHEFPTEFAGGLAMCPAGPELFDFFTATAAAAEVITGVHFTSMAAFAQDTASMAAALGQPPNLSERGWQLASVQIHISGGPRPFAVEGLASRFLQNIGGAALAGAASPANRAVTNAAVRYSIDQGLGLSADQLDAAVRRKPADPEIRNPTGPFDELVPFDGHLERPVMTMHGTGDLFVPIVLERALQRAVSAAGKADLLVQRIYRIAGHCGFSPAEESKAFDDLVRWVRTGVKPAGDDVTGDLSDAGRAFTDPLRPGDPGQKRVEARVSR